MLVNFLLFIPPPMLTKLCLRWILLNLISMMDCESFKKRLADEFYVFLLLLLYNSCQISCRVLKNWKARNMLATTLMGRKSMRSWIYILLAWEFKPIPLPFLTQFIFNLEMMRMIINYKLIFRSLRCLKWKWSKCASVRDNTHVSRNLKHYWSA